MPCRKQILRCIHIGVVHVPTGHALESGLGSAVVRRNMATRGARLTRVLRRHHDEPAPSPRELVLELSPEPSPSLIEDGFVQAGLGPHVSTWLLDGACRRLGQIPDLQVLHDHHRVGLAEGGGGFVQVVLTDMADAGMKALDCGLCLLPVLTERDLPAHDPLCFPQASFVFLETIERFDVASIAQGGEPDNTQIDPHGTRGRGHGGRHLPLCLDRHKPFPTGLADRDVLHGPQDETAVAIPHPAQLRQIEAVVGVVEPDPLRKAHGLMPPFLLPLRVLRPVREKVAVGAVEILQRLLQRLTGGERQPRGRGIGFPANQLRTQSRVAEMGLALLIARTLKRQAFVEHIATGPCKPTQEPFLFASGLDPVAERLEMVHGNSTR